MSALPSSTASIQLTDAVYFEPAIYAVVIEWQQVDKESFYSVLEYVLQLMRQYKTGKILAKVVNWSSESSKHSNWFEHNWLPRALRVGYKAYAAVGPVHLLSELIISSAATQVQGQGVKVSFFKSLTDAQEWLRTIA